MGLFKQKMIDKMTIRGLSLNTQSNYLESVTKFIKFFNKSPDLITLHDIYSFQLYDYLCFFKILRLIVINILIYSYFFLILSKVPSFSNKSKTCFNLV